MTRVLLVEDDPLISASLGRALRARGFGVDVVESVRAAERADEWDLMLCDLGLPDGDGLDLIRRVTELRPSRRIIALTARAEESDVIAGLTSGAVDYVTKPFRLAELFARIDVQLRMHDATERDLASVRRIGDLWIDLESRRVTVGTAEVALRRKEFELLVRLAASAGKVVRRNDLINDVWGENWWGTTKTLDVHINSIRRKLGDRAGSPSRIRAVRGVGYRLDAR